MKRQLLIIIFLIANISVHSQTAKENITKEVLSYFNTFNNHDFEKSLTYMPDEIFEVSPRETVLETMKSTFNNPEMPITFKNVKVISVEKPVAIDKKYYSLLKYGAVLSIKFNKTSSLDSKKLLNVYTETYGEKNVRYFADDNRYELYYEKNICAISTNVNTSWKLIEIEPKDLELLKSFIPKQILNKL